MQLQKLKLRDITNPIKYDVTNVSRDIIFNEIKIYSLVRDIPGTEKSCMFLKF